ncbi:MAG: T9SS type A sorting domain-containing protein [Bacteroidetes bacterium]|nr:T9SS type A sorting domain-containing protein [Bacteroidota bacterium]
MKIIKLTKTIGIIFLFLFSSFSASSQHLKSQQSSNASEVLFFDDFEETISNDATFANWTTENLEGWHYWHIIPWGGAGGGQCLRFENTDINQNDWIITNAINCSEAENLKISFNHFFHGEKIPPKLYYTSQYNGDASQSAWTEISYSLGENTDEWYLAEDIIIENPGETIYFGFHYESTPETAIYFLLDNFWVKNYKQITYELTGSSEHFNYYTQFQDHSDFHLEIKNDLEAQYNKFTSLWDRPGKEKIFSENEKIKVYYSEKENIEFITTETPSWKNGFHNTNKLEIFLSPLQTTAQENYYTNLTNLAINEFSQLAIEKKLTRDQNNNFPPYFMEGFGLYESGFRPCRDSIVKYLNETDSNIDFLLDTTGICNTLKRDVIISSIEGQLLSGDSYLRVGPMYSSYFQERLPKYWKYFYAEPENQRIKLIISTNRFDFYGAISDSSHFSEIVNYFENAYSFYISKYNFEPKHRFNVVIVPTETIGMQLLNYDDYFNGGVGCGGDLVIQLSPNYNFNQQDYDKYYAGLSAHEFFHIYYNHFMWQIPSGFWAEGSADFSARHFLGNDIRRERFWMIEWTFNEYAQKHNIELNLEHISKNPNLELDIYYLGDMFFEYLYQFHGGYEKIIEFFNQQMDFSVFESTYEEIDKGYINYLKSLVGINTASDEIDDNDLNFWFSNKQIFIQNSSQSNRFKINVFAVTGQKLFQKEISITSNETQNFSIPNLEAFQFYIVRIKSKHETIIKKLINSAY